MKAKLLLITGLTATAINTYAAEATVLKHTEQAAPHTQLILTPLKADKNAPSKSTPNRAQDEEWQQSTYADTKLTAITSHYETTTISGATSYIIWNMPKDFRSRTFIVSRAVCVSEDETGTQNCSQADDEILAQPDIPAYADGKIQISQVLTPGAKYHAIIKIRIKNTDSAEVFATSSDWQPFTASTNITK